MALAKGVFVFVLVNILVFLLTWGFAVLDLGHWNIAINNRRRRFPLASMVASVDPLTVYITARRLAASASTNVDVAAAAASYPPIKSESFDLIAIMFKSLMSFIILFVLQRTKLSLVLMSHPYICFALFIAAFAQ